MPKHTARGQHRLNWRPDLPDARDLRFANTQTCKALAEDPKLLPTSVDLRPKCPPVVDQLSLGSCTSQALAGAMGFLELKEMAAAPTAVTAAGVAAVPPILAPEEFSSSAFAAFSRLQIYWNERVIEGDTDQDGGAQLRDGIKSLAASGACSETTWPYVVENAMTAPSEAAVAEAAKHKISTYARLDNTQINELKSCLALGYPFVFGFSVYSNFQSDETAATGVLTMPGHDDAPDGGHAVLAVGYDDARQIFIVRNSWGSSWGAGGYFFMPFDYICNENLADDFWVIRR